MIDALSPLGSMGDGVAGGEGAIYLWGKLPEGCSDDDAIVEWLVREHGVCLIPGSSCGCPGEATTSPWIDRFCEVRVDSYASVVLWLSLTHQCNFICLSCFGVTIMPLCEPDHLQKSGEG